MINNQPLVTIGIPTYNRAKTYLRDTLESALSQKYPNIEIIVADNCSDDTTQELMRSYTDPRIRYIRHETNIGPFNNMNSCLHVARGEYILLLHDDDLIDSDFVETCMRAINYRNDIGIIITGSRIIDATGRYVTGKENTGENVPGVDFLLMFYQKKIHFFLCCVLFNTEYLKEIGGIKKEYNKLADAAAEFQIIARYRRVDVPEIKASFRSHNDSLGKTSNIAVWCDDYLRLLDLACKLANGKIGLMRKYGMNSSADRMYRYSIERVPTKLEKIKSFYIVWKKFNYRYYPSQKHLIALIPWFYYPLNPIKTVKKLLKKLNHSLGLN
jgi:glycosyltransferase involved in cell wall biosynthesis